MRDTLDNAIAAIARRQYGYITRAQLLALGLGDKAISYRLARGWLIPVYAGVYAVGHAPVAPVARSAAAVLACGPNAVLSHGSAASLWGFFKRWAMPFHVTAPSDHRRQGICVHRSRALTRADRRTHLGIRVT